MKLLGKKIIFKEVKDKTSTLILTVEDNKKNFITAEVLNVGDDASIDENTLKIGTKIFVSRFDADELENGEYLLHTDKIIGLI